MRKPVGNGVDRFEMLVEALPFDEFHGVEDAAISQRSHVVNRHDAGMLEPREHSGLTHQAAGKFALRAGYFKNFQRHAALQFFVFGGIHHSHASARNLAHQLVACAAEVGKLRAIAQPRESFV